MLDFAVKLTAEPWASRRTTASGCASAGFSDRDIWDIAAVAGFFNMSNRVASATDMRPNAVYHGRRGDGLLLSCDGLAAHVDNRGIVPMLIGVTDKLGHRQVPMIRVLSFAVALLFAAIALAQSRRSSPDAADSAGDGILAHNGMVVAQEAAPRASASRSSSAAATRSTPRSRSALRWR